jgi:hypothetical protein
VTTTKLAGTTGDEEEKEKDAVDRRDDMRFLWIIDQDQEEARPRRLKLKLSY